MPYNHFNFCPLLQYCSFIIVNVIKMVPLYMKFVLDSQSWINLTSELKFFKHLFYFIFSNISFKLAFICVHSLCPKNSLGLLNQVQVLPLTQQRLILGCCCSNSGKWSIIQKQVTILNVNTLGSHYIEVITTLLQLFITSKETKYEEFACCVVHDHSKLSDSR